MNIMIVMLLIKYVNIYVFVEYKQLFRNLTYCLITLKLLCNFIINCISSFK